MPYDPNSRITLDLDLTGTNPDNLVVGEEHTLSSRPTKSLATQQGPFYGESITITDNGVPLVRGIDYLLPNLHQEATLKTGKEVYSIVLIIKSQVSSKVTVNYQAIGGHYNTTGSNVAIASLFETLRNDNRPVQYDNVLNKPKDYDPTNHRHLLTDVFGFEAVVDHLERIKNAITIGQTSVLMSAMKAMINKMPCEDLPKVLPKSDFIQYDAMLYFLSSRKLLSKIHIDSDKCTWMRGRSMFFFIDTTSIPVGTPVHWEFYREDGRPVTTVARNKGTVVSDGTRMSVNVYLSTESNVSEEFLYLGAKLNQNQEDFDAVSYAITLTDCPVTNEPLGLIMNLSRDSNVISHLPHEYNKTDGHSFWYRTTQY